MGRSTEPQLKANAKLANVKVRGAGGRVTSRRICIAKASTLYLYSGLDVGGSEGECGWADGVDGDYQDAGEDDVLGAGFE